MIDKVKKATELLTIILKSIIHKNKIILCNTPIHENLGDHAIAVAEIDFFAKFFPELVLVEIPENICTKKILKCIKPFIRKKDLVILQGGGFMGDLWPRHEVCMHNVIDTFANNMIVIFPQTCFFMGSMNEDYFDYYRENVNRVYLFSREKNTYELFVNKGFSTSHCFLSPDIVMSLFYDANSDRNGVGLCLRNDKESTLSDSDKYYLVNLIDNIGEKIDHLSTLCSTCVSVKERRFIVKLKLQEFALHKLIITDRLHGMIFAAITGTPCIAIDNVSSKVSGVYAWISNLEYIHICKPEAYILFQFFKARIELEEEYISMAKIIEEIMGSNTK